MTTITMPPPRIGRVALTVADLDRSIRFYEDVIGLAQLGQADGVTRMGVGDETLLLLHHQPGARPVQRATGLYHFAILVPSRHDLARSLYRLLQDEGPVSGYSDHGVSEALYLSDPDGHGIEIYRDRPRSEWPMTNGRLAMVSIPLDLRGVLNELAGGPAPAHHMAEGTFVGHIHLQVAQIAATEQFYTGLLGLDLVQRYGPSATFMSANGYHHHVGANTWAGAGLAPAPADAARLLWYEIRLPDAAAKEAIAEHLTTAAYPFDRDDEGVWLTDPSGIRVLLSAKDQ